MDINIRMSNLTPGELAKLVPILEELQQAQTERIVAKTEMYKAQAEAAQVYEEPQPKVEEQPTIDMEALRAALNALKQDKGTEVVRTLLEKFGVKRVPDIPPEKYPEVVDMIAELYNKEG